MNTEVNIVPECYVSVDGEDVQVDVFLRNPPVIFQREADVRAANSILEIFGYRIAVPDYEIERWKEYKGIKRRLDRDT